eukprot:COSAG03_NODE_39_length_17408_cov_16.363972_12_plen_67_part_00
MHLPFIEAPHLPKHSAPQFWPRGFSDLRIGAGVGAQDCMVVLYGGFARENARKRNLRGSNPRALAI